MNDVIEIIKVIGSTLALILAPLWAYLKFRERRLTKQYRLQPNPTRCGEMVARVENLEKQFDDLEENNRDDHKQIFTQIGALAIEVARLGRNGKGP